MSKSQVEKYEQMLSQDPTSTVFVELARVYLERGDNDRALVVCQQGCSHHPNSVIGRVLWGKALINVGRAAEAMKQFDVATGIDRDNPHAYNLIGEVLLRKGLYRSALPMLRKASQLQPNDGRLREWLEQTKAALAGGPAPVLPEPATAPSAEELESTSSSAPSQSTPAPVDLPPADDGSLAAPALAPSGPVAAPVLAAPSPLGPPPPTAGFPQPTPSAPGADPDVFSTIGAGPALTSPDPSAEPTVVMAAYSPERERELAFNAPPLTVTAEVQVPPAPEAFPSAPKPSARIPSRDNIPVLRRADELPQGSAAAGKAESPRVSVSEVRTSSQEQLPLVAGQIEGAPSTLELPLPPAAAEAPDPFAVLPQRTMSGETVRGLTSTFDALQPAASAPLTATRTPLPLPAVSGGLLDEVLSERSVLPSAEMPAISAPPGRPRQTSGGLLDEIPEFVEPSGPVPVAKSEYSAQATEAIAREYERELREKLEANTKKKTFLQQHGFKVAIAAMLAVVVLGGGGAYLYTNFKNAGRNLDQTLVEGKKRFFADTRRGYTEAVSVFTQATQMDDTSTEAWAYLALSHAELYAEHGGGEAAKNAALTAVSRANVRTAYPDVAEVVDYLLADPANATAAQQQILGSTQEKSTYVQTQIGRVLLAQKKADEAYKRLLRAVDLEQRNVRALVTLGDYYLGFDDYENAVKVFGMAEQFSRMHPSRVMGMAQARLALGREANEALGELETLISAAKLDEAQMARYTMLLGRAQSAVDHHDDAEKTLTDGLTTFKGRELEFQLALGDVLQAAGRMERAQKAYEEAIKLKPKSEAAKEGLGRTLLARSREKEVLERLKESDGKQAALIRGIALIRLGDPKRARAELTKTQISVGKYPAEAAVYLALADAAEEGQADKSQALLEKLAQSTKRHKATVQVALARVYLRRNQLTQARALLEEASKDPRDYEANAMLGELLMSAGLPADVALEPLERAVSRNGSYALARHLLTRGYLAQGRAEEATKQVEAWTADNPTLEVAWKDAALVYWQTGRLKDAEAAILKAVGPDSIDIEGLRLRAQIAFARNEGAVGMPVLERANKLNPKDAETFCEIGNLMARQANVEVAGKAYDAARTNDPKALCAQIGPHHLRPSAKGVKDLQSIIRLSSDVWVTAWAQATLARVLLEERDVKAAQEMAESAVRSGPFHPAAWFAMGEVARRIKSEAKAKEAYGKAAELSGSWAAARFAYGDTLLKGGGESLAQALVEYEAGEQLTSNEAERARAKKVITSIKKQLR